MSLRLHSYAERRGDAATAARVVQEGLQTSWEQIWCPGLRLTVSYLRHGVASFASTAGGRDIRTTSTPRRPARTRTWAAAVDAIIQTHLARRDATTALLCGPPDRRVSLGFSAGEVRTFSVLSIVMLDYSLPATRRLGNAPGVTSWDWM